MAANIRVYQVQGVCRVKIHHFSLTRVQNTAFFDSQVFLDNRAGCEARLTVLEDIQRRMKDRQDCRDALRREGLPENIVGIDTVGVREIWDRECIYNGVSLSYVDEATPNH